MIAVPQLWPAPSFAKQAKLIAAPHCDSAKGLQGTIASPVAKGLITFAKQCRYAQRRVQYSSGRLAMARGDKFRY